KRRASPVRARSPPDRSVTDWSRLPRGCAIRSTPVSSGSPSSSASTNRSSARPPSNSRSKIFWKWRLISSKAWAKRSCALRVMPAHAALRRREVELVVPRDEPPDLALDPAALALDGPQALGELLVRFGGEARLALDPVALDRDLTRADVRALALLGEPGAPALQLPLPLAGLREPVDEVALHVGEALELATERVHAFRRPGGLH